MKIFLFIAAIFLMFASVICYISFAKNRTQQADFIVTFILGFMLLTVGYFIKVV